MRHAHASTVHLYDRLFRVPNPGAERDFIEDLNPDSMKSITAQLEHPNIVDRPALASGIEDAKRKLHLDGGRVALIVPDPSFRVIVPPISGRSRDTSPDRMRLSNFRYATIVLSMASAPLASLTGFILSSTTAFPLMFGSNRLW